MSGNEEQVALLVRHRARPGLRDQVRRVWQKYVQPRVESSSLHETYHFCYDRSDPDVVIAFQVYRNQQALDEFLGGQWYPEYLREVGEFIVTDPEIVVADPVWSKWGAAEN